MINSGLLRSGFCFGSARARTKGKAHVPSTLGCSFYPCYSCLARAARRFAMAIDCARDFAGAFRFGAQFLCPAASTSVCESDRYHNNDLLL